MPNLYTISLSLFSLPAHRSGYKLASSRTLDLKLLPILQRWWWWLQGKQPQEEIWPEKCKFCWFTPLCACLVALWICWVCCNWAAALHSSAFRWTTPILFIHLSSKFDLIFSIFTWKNIPLLMSIKNAKWVSVEFCESFIDGKEKGNEKIIRYQIITWIK